MAICRLPGDLHDWRVIEDAPDGSLWHPFVFDRAVPEQRVAMDELMGCGRVAQVLDTFEAQVADLVRARAPSQQFTRAELDAALDGLIDRGASSKFGRWVYFPWTQRMVHTLEPGAFAELRSDRNRNKITSAEQEVLGRLRIGLAGLSVGNAVATTLALEGLFGELRMADFDTLELSNMNRIRCGIHDLGLNKAVLCARQIFEQNPYARLVLYTDGVTADNIDSFMDEGGRLDIVIDECDSLMIKVRLREEARRRQIPVIMETSDRGLLDIERFDLTPERPILHGLLGGLTSTELERWPPEQRLGLILKIVGVETLSSRALASLMEMGQSVRGLSQLGSDVTLGGATSSIAVRSIALGRVSSSGRVWIDVASQLTELVQPGADEQRARADELEYVRGLVDCAIMAPSRGNLQPLRFRYERDAERGGQLHVQLVTPTSEAAVPELEFVDGWIAAGAAIENAVIGASDTGRALAVEVSRESDDAALVATLRLDAGSATPDPLLNHIPRRVTNRREGDGRALEDDALTRLTDAAAQAGGMLRAVRAPAALEALGALLGEADRLALLTPRLHDRFFHALRLVSEGPKNTRDGIGLRALELTPREHASLQMILDKGACEVLRDVGGGQPLTLSARRRIPRSGALALVTVRDGPPAGYVLGGRVLERVWLTATALGVAVHPVNVLLDLLAIVENEWDAELREREVASVTALGEQFAEHFGVDPFETKIALLRLSYAREPAQRSRRRSAESALIVDA